MLLDLSQGLRIENREQLPFQQLEPRGSESVLLSPVRQAPPGSRTPKFPALFAHLERKTEGRQLLAQTGQAIGGSVEGAEIPQKVVVAPFPSQMLIGRILEWSLEVPHPPEEIPALQRSNSTSSSAASTTDSQAVASWLCRRT